MRRKGSLICAILLMSAILASSVYAASGSAKVYYNSDLSVGTTSSINTYLNGIGYSSSRSSNPSKSVINNSFKNNKVVHILSHGLDGGGAIQASDGWLYTTNMSGDYSGCKLAFLEICQGAKSNSTYGAVSSRCKTLGVTSTIAFKNNISAIGSDDGIHFFAKRVYYYLCNNAQTISAAVSVAKTELYNRYGEYYGADSCQTYGGAAKIR